jgi:hypothetical protein
MSAGIANLTIEQGADFAAGVLIQHYSGSGTTLVPFDLTGYTVKAQVRSEYESKRIIAELIPVGTMDDTGTFQLTLPASTTEKLQPMVGVWDMFIYASGIQTLKILQGQAIVTPQVTR